VKDTGASAEVEGEGEEAPPRFSIVIPIYNEQAILHAAVVDLRERLAPLGLRYEILLAENGSRDETLVIAKELADK
jgi:glycosyltransferase involved in cell wall biosynthesis